jgi:DNA/RNA endonuclease YhcR with UshA esterase domain
MKNLKVVKTYTTTNETSSSKGAMTLTCQVDGETVDIRTIVLYDADGKLVTADRFAGKTIDVKGIIDCYDGAYQIKVFSVDDIIVH